MKRILVIAVLLASFGVSQSHAQFLKELKKRVLEKTQQQVIEKASDKVAGKVAEKFADETGEVMDKLLNHDFGKLMNPIGKNVDMSKLPASYKFDYRYALKMTTQEGEIDFDYFLNKTEPYMGAKMNMGMDMSIVFDEGNKTVFTYVNGMGIATEMDLSNAVDKEDVNKYNDYTFKELPNRQFLGYDCVGREMENEEYKNGLMMHMEMVDKKNKKKKNNSVTMDCVAFEPSNLVINTR